MRLRLALGGAFLLLLPAVLADIPALALAGLLAGLAPVSARVDGRDVVIRNGLTTTRVPAARVTRQLVRVLGGKGGDWFWSDRCLAVWEAGAEDGHPVLAGIRVRDSEVDALGGLLAAALGVPYQRDAVPSNAWSPGAKNRRRAA